MSAFILALLLAWPSFSKCVPAQAQSVNLTLNDLAPEYGQVAAVTGVQGDPIQLKKVTYPVVAKASYDTFFLNAAKLRGILIADRAIAAGASDKMKGIAVAALAKINEGKKAVSAKFEKVTTPPEQWTLESVTSMLQQARAEGVVAQEQLDELKSLALAIGKTTASLGKLPGSANDLRAQGQQLSGSASKDFSDNCEKTKLPAVTQALKDDGESLTNVPAESADLSKELARLTTALSTCCGG